MIIALSAAITCQTDQKFEKFQMMLEFPELVSDVVAGVGVAVDNGAGVIAGVVAVADADVTLRRC